MSLFDNGYYLMNKRGLIGCGIWPDSTKFQAWTMRIIITAIEFSLVIPEHIHLYKVWGNYDAVILCLPQQMITCMIFFKFYTLASNQKMVKSGIEQIINDWNFLSNESIDEIMHKHGVLARHQTILFSYCCYFVLGGYFGGTMLPVVLDIIIPLNQSRVRNPPFETDYLVNFEDNFYKIVLHGLSGGVVLCIWLWTVDTFIIVMIQHCCGLFETTGFILEKLNSNNKKKHSEKYEINVILLAITIHKRAIAFADFIETAFTTLYASVVMICLLMISVTGVSVIMRFDQRNEAIKLGTLTCGAILILFFNTLPSQALIDESTRLSTLIYDCDWTSLTIKSQKLILIMLVRSFRPCTLTAGKIYKMNMESFSQVLRTAMSYLTVLSSFQ